MSAKCVTPLDYVVFFNIGISYMFSFYNLKRA